MKYVLGVLVFMVGILVGYFVFSGPNVVENVNVDENTSSENTVTQEHYPIRVNTPGPITCTYPQVLHVSYEDGQVKHTLPKKETSPLIFTFTDLKEEVSKIQYIDATQTISDAPVVVLHEDDAKIVILEGNGENYLTTHTIFKKSGVSIYSKQVYLSTIDVPSGSMAMGTCK